MRGLCTLLLVWLTLLCLLGVTATTKRKHEHLELRSRLLQHLEPVAEIGADSVDSYIWGYSFTSLSGSYARVYYGSPQAHAVYLLHRGFGSPVLLRSLLLCEARRCRDWQYLYLSVNNYDLRTALTRHCLSNFPNDPRVHWAAGQLALAAGDFKTAERELARTLELADDLKQFCKSAGISEQHLRGRYACALLLMARRDDAEQQYSLAEASGDGAHPPPLHTDDYREDDWFRQQYPAEYEAYRIQRNAEDLRLQEMDGVVRHYLNTRDTAVLDELLEELEVARRKASNQDGHDSSIQAQQLRNALLRAYLLAHDWQSARQLLEETGSVGTDYSTQLRPLIGLLLTRLASGQKLGRTADENHADKLAQLERDQLSSHDRWWDWELQSAECGELSGLLAADYLPFLLRTDGFLDALAKSGRSHEAVLAEIRSVVQPQRNNYFDVSNGKLRWR